MWLMSLPIQGVLFTVFQSIFEVFLLCLAGFTLSFKGIVDKPTSKVLNHINIALFTPALLFSKVAYFLTPAKLRQLWVIPIFFCVLTALSAVIGHGLARACRLKRSQVHFATAASMFMNSNSLPVALMQSLATTVPVLKWGPDDTVDAMFGRSLTYLVVFSTLGMMLRWSYGVRLLSKVDEESPTTPPSTTYCDEPALTHVSADPSALVDYDIETNVDLRNRRAWCTRPLHSRLTPLSRRHTHPHVHSHLPAVPTSLGDQSESEESDETTEGGDSEDTLALRSEHIDTEFSTETEDHTPVQAPVPLASTSAPNATPRWDRSARPSFLMRFLSMFTSLSPPLIASLFALFCVLVPPVQRVLKLDEMIPFKGALDSAGGCSIPVTMLVLGGWFWDGDSKRKNKHSPARSRGQGNAKSKGKHVQERRATQCAPHHIIPQSHDSSTTSLASMIGAFGGVLMGRVPPRRPSDRATWRVSATTAADDDVEHGLLATHTETEIEYAENGPGRSRSRTEAAQLSRNSASSPARGNNPPGETLTVIVTLLARMVVVPLVATPLLVLVSRLGWGGEVFEDPVFIVSSMLLIASPPALTLAQISQRKTPDVNAPDGDVDTFSPYERLLSRTVFWSYLVLTPPLTIASVMVGLLLIGA